MLRRVYDIALRECAILWKNPIYAFCMVGFPLLSVVFFTSLMSGGVPEDLPVGVVDQDHTSESRQMAMELDACQSVRIAAWPINVTEAQDAMKRGEIYGYVLIPEGTTREIYNGKQPHLSFYYSNLSLVAGSMVYKDLKTVLTLRKAKVGITKLAAVGKTDEEIATSLQPIALDMHMVGNPYSNYNYYLSTTMVPGVILLLVFLVTPFSIGTELKFGRSREWLSMADNNIYVALLGKLLPQTLVFLAIFLAFEFYIYGVLRFPHPGGAVPILLLGLLSVLACQSFGVFAFGLTPSLRMSMSICSLWGVISFSICGATFPVSSMHPSLQSIAVLFPLRHYYMVYQETIFHGFPLQYALPHIVVLILFLALPFLVAWNIKKAMLIYKYIP